jgi:hypothetical protein
MAQFDALFRHWTGTDENKKSQDNWSPESMITAIMHYAMKAYGGSGGIASIVLASALDGGEWSASRPCRFTPTDIGPGTRWIGGWLGPRARLDATKKKK